MPLHKQYIPHVNALMYSAVSLKDKKTCIFKELIPQWYKVAFFHSFAKERVIQYYLHYKSMFNKH